jgi:hypothetical protein
MFVCEAKDKAEVVAKLKEDPYVIAVSIASFGVQSYVPY